MSAYRVKPGEAFYIYSMGKRLRVVAYAMTNDDANAYMEQHTEAAVVACFGGGLILMADKHDRGERDAT